MGNSTDKYENDPYIEQANSANNPLRQIYTSSSAIPLSEGQKGKLSIDLLASQQQKKVTTAYQTPIQIDSNSITLTKDGYNPQLYYISFKYSCQKYINASFYLNAEFTQNPQNGWEYFQVPPAFKNMIMKQMLNPGSNQTFQDPNVYIDAKYFLNNKSYFSGLHDVIIELTALDMNQRVECIIAFFCKIISKENRPISIKPMMQKCKVYGSEWYDIQSIYGILSEEKLCEICCANQKNTYFIPCKHSYACKDCAILLRVRSESCPLCRQPITDSVILETNSDFHS